jgi:hypothetical protein
MLTAKSLKAKYFSYFSLQQIHVLKGKILYRAEFHCRREAAVQ